jgi:hypothetical protein
MAWAEHLVVRRTGTTASELLLPLCAGSHTQGQPVEWVTPWRSSVRVVGTLWGSVPVTHLRGIHSSQDAASEG